MGVGSPVDTTSPEATRARLDRILGRELRQREDRELAEQLEPRIRDAMPCGAELGRISCSASFCKLELSYPDQESYRAFVAACFGSNEELLWSGTGVVDVVSSPPESRGDVIAVAYLGRRADTFD